MLANTIVMKRNFFTVFKLRVDTDYGRNINYLVVQYDVFQRKVPIVSCATEHFILLI